jgi:hypothetical protein
MLVLRSDHSQDGTFHAQRQASELPSRFRGSPVDRIGGGIRTRDTYLTLIFFTALVREVSPAWFVALTVQV